MMVCNSRTTVVQHAVSIKPRETNDLGHSKWICLWFRMFARNRMWETVVEVFHMPKDVRLLGSNRTTIVRKDVVVRLSTTSLVLHNNTFPYTWNLLYDCLQQVWCCTTTRFHTLGCCCTTAYNKSGVAQQHVTIHWDVVVRLSTTSLVLHNNTFPYTWNLLYDCLQQVWCCTTTRFHTLGCCCTTVYNKSGVAQQHVTIHWDVVVRPSTTSLVLHNNTFPYTGMLLYDCLQQVWCCTTTRFHTLECCCTTVYNKSGVAQQHVSIHWDVVVRLSTTSLVLHNNTFPYTWNFLYDCLQQVWCCATTRFHILGICCTTVCNKSGVVQHYVSIYLEFVVRLPCDRCSTVA